MPTKDLQTLWKDYPVPMPDVAGDGVETRGGFDLPDGRKETPSEELGQTVTTVQVPDAPGVNAQIPMPGVKDHMPGTLPTSR